MPTRRAPAARLAACLLPLLAAAAGLMTMPAIAAADACTPPVASAVACENTKPGAPSNTWAIDGAGDPTIQGFATQMSVNRGETISFKIKSDTSNYRIDILRLGYYGGNGARLIASNLSPTSPSAQPPCQTFSDTGLIDCGNWSVSRTWTVPSTAVSGIYIAHLVRNDTGGDSHITFVVRDDSSTASTVLQTSDTTWQAYNDYGGNSLYKCAVACPPGEPLGYKAAYKVSYNRPVQTEGASQLFSGAEYAMVRFVEANGYDLTYLSGVDVHRRPQLLLDRDLFISSGHDEYWSATQRNAMEDARDAGVSFGFFSGNEGFWKTRWEPSAAGPVTQDRTVVSYKDTHFSQRQDPVEWTGTWRDPRFTTPEENVTPENALTGQTFAINSGTSRITVPYEYRRLRMWRNTDATSLSPGQSLQLAPETLGVEWDEDADNGFRPAGSFRLSSTTVTGLELFIDYGSHTRFGGTATHNLTMYKVPSGARVFGAGTMQWAFGLSEWNRAGTPPDRNMQQATVNLFADMGVQATTLQSNLVAPTATTDTTAPTATIASPPSSASDGAVVNLTGTASDAGGVVGGIEVSTDGGASWHLASGTDNWTYRWIAHGAPSANVKVRATDDSGNTSVPGAGVNVAINCPCSIWGDNIAPATADGGDPSSVEVGVKFRTDTYGTITGIKFYKAATNTGTHSGSLWTTGGQRLAQATFTSESASGWQSVSFAEPVEVFPGTTYVASYHAPNGHYSATPDSFYRAPSPGPNGGAIADGAPLHVVRNTTTSGNGVYSYATNSAFPASSYGAANYWVDVMFSPTPAPGQVTGVSAAAGGFTSANVTWNAPSSGGLVTAYKVTPYIGSTPQTAKTVSASTTSTTITGLTTGTSYTFRVEASNPNGTGPASAASNAVTPTGAVAPAAPSGVVARPASQSARVTWTAAASDGDSAITGQTVTPYIDGTPQSPVQVSASATSATVSGLSNGTSYTFRVTATNAVGTSPPSPASTAIEPQATLFDFATPVGIDVPGGPPVELGVKFTADNDGFVTGVRFHKGPGNSGTHVGTLWTSTGTPLAQATFTKETSSGWQHVTFSSPVPVTGGTTYIASYFSPGGAYTATGGGLSSAVRNAPLTALGNGATPNGVYGYGSTSTFPINTYNGANYWVDVLYALPKPAQVTNVSASAGGFTSANLTWTAPSSGGPVSSYKITPYVGSTPQTPKTVSAPATSATMTGLTTGTTYTFRIEAVNANGAGPASAASNAVTPTSAVVPSPPTGVEARPATKSARVIWDASASDGDSAITGQTVTPYVGSSAQTPVQVSASATSATVTGLDNGTSYTFRVTARNAVGSSPASNPSSAVTPQATIFDFVTPGIADGGDTNPVEVGVKFRASFNGSVTGVRFYKAAGNTGTHVGSLWSASGTRLAQATFTNETASGWQHVTFSSPVTVTPDTTYVASYHAPNGHYSITTNGFSSAVDNPPVHGLANSTSPNGVYAYGSTSQFPAGSYLASNYMVDVLFAPAPVPGAPTGVAATPGQASATVSWTAPTSGGPVTSYEVTPYLGSVAQPSKTVTGTPPSTSTTVSGLTSGATYTFRVRAGNPTGTGPASNPSGPVVPLSAVVPGAPTGVAAQGDDEAAIVRWTAPNDDGGSNITGYTVTPFIGGTAQAPLQAGASATSLRVGSLTNGTAYTFTVKATNGAGTGASSAASSAVTPRDSIFGAGTPVVADGGDTNPIVVGVKFSADVNGSVTGLRFYKSAANTGTHVGTLWSATGTSLAQANFTNETGSGWQALTFAAPVAVTAGTTYVASYLAPNGHYSVTGAAFTTSPIANPPLQALAAPNSPNGVYVYGSTPGFPTSSYNASNYWVDVLFDPAP